MCWFTLRAGILDPAASSLREEHLAPEVRQLALGVTEFAAFVLQALEDVTQFLLEALLLLPEGGDLFGAKPILG